MNKPASFVIILALCPPLAALAALPGCDKGGSSGAATTSATTASDAPSTASGASGAAALAGSGIAPAPSARPAASGLASGAAGDTAAPAAEGGTSTWKGTYKAKVGEVTPPKAAEVKLWAKDPGTAAVGDGTLTLTLSGAGARRLVKGEAKGPLGDLVFSGDIDGKDVSARVDPRDPNAPEAMTGFLQGKLDGASLTGTIRVSSRNGNMAREAEIKLTKAE